MIRVVLSLMLALHGIIHFIGFAKAFGLGNKLPIEKMVSRPAGILWLLVALLFTTASALLLMKKDHWHVMMLASIISQVLIITVWADAKWGTIANILAMGAAILNFASWQFRHNADRRAQEIMKAVPAQIRIITTADVQTLPPVVQRWVTRSGVIGKPMTHTVRLTQSGTLRPDGKGKWMPVSAQQYFSTAEPSFIWLADIDGGMLHIAGRDDYNSGHGTMTIKLASLFTVANEAGQRIDQGTLLRYLAEIQWFPAAALSRYISWEQTSDSTANATMNWGGVSATGTFHFSHSGDITAFEADRYMQRGKESSLERWYVPVTGYREFEGIRVPSSGHTIWQLKTGDLSWFDWEITAINYNTNSLF